MPRQDNGHAVYIGALQGIMKLDCCGMQTGNR
jgi:hypothetical protein